MYVKRNGTSHVVDKFCGTFFPSQIENNKVSDILLFGPIGSGKSAFINSCYTLLSSKDAIVGNIAQSGSSQNHCTSELKSYRLVSLESKKPTGFRLVDSWGVTASNYDPGFVTLLFGGKIPGGWKMSTPFRLADGAPQGGEKPFKPHCVIFFVPASDLEMNSRYLDRIVQCADVASRLSVSCVYAITKVDDISAASPNQSFSRNSSAGNLRSSLDYSEQRVQQLILKAAKLFNTNENQVVALMNYKNENLKSLQLDKWIYRLLHAAAAQASAKNLSDDLHSLIFD